MEKQYGSKNKAANIEKLNKLLLKLWIIFNVLYVISSLALFLLECLYQKDSINRIYQLTPIFSYLTIIVLTLCSLIIIITYWPNRKIMYYTSLIYVIIAILINIYYVFAINVYSIINLFFYMIITYIFYRGKEYILRS